MRRNAKQRRLARREREHAWVELPYAPHALWRGGAASGLELLARDYGSSDDDALLQPPAALLTGRHSDRTGIGTIIASFDGVSTPLPLSETILPEALDQPVSAVATVRVSAARRASASEPPASRRSAASSPDSSWSCARRPPQPCQSGTCGLSLHLQTRDR